MNREFNETRTGLANEFATAGATLLDYMGTAAALAAIPSTEPPRYVVAGMLAEIVKLLPAAGAIAESAAAQPVAASAGIDGLPADWKDRLFESMQAAFDLYESGTRDEDGQRQGMRFDDTQIGVEFAISQIERLLATQSAKQGAQPSEDFVLMPKRLTAENGAKGAMSGEFKESVRVTCHECNGSGDDPEFEGENTEHGSACPECNGDGTLEQSVPVEWDTIKRIYAMAVALLSDPAAPLQTMDDTTRDADLYTCIEKGGEYELLGEAYGAGTSKGSVVSIYRDTASLSLFFRSVDDFGKRMRPVSPASTDQKGSD